MILAIVVKQVLIPWAQRPQKREKKIPISNVEGSEVGTLSYPGRGRYQGALIVNQYEEIVVGGWHVNAPREGRSLGPVRGWVHIASINLQTPCFNLYSSRNAHCSRTHGRLDTPVRGNEISVGVICSKETCLSSSPVAFTPIVHRPGDGFCETADSKKARAARGAKAERRSGEGPETRARRRPSLKQKKEVSISQQSPQQAVVRVNCASEETGRSHAAPSEGAGSPAQKCKADSIDRPDSSAMHRDKEGAGGRMIL
eukprot:1431024-Rhodomonas_salina.2